MSNPGRSIANIRLWLLRAYLHDLEEFRGGDVNRFGRMVDGKGNSCGSESAWTDKVRELLKDSFIVEFRLDALPMCVERAAKLGIEVNK